MVLLAYLLEIDGDVHIGLFERLEAELRELQRRGSTRERARQLLQAYSTAGTLNAIRSKNLSLSSSDGPRPYLGL